MDGRQPSIDLSFLLIAGTLLMVFLVGSIVAAILIHQKKMLKEQMRAQTIEIANQRRITNAILSTQEEERRRIAQDLHDELGSMIFSLKMKLGDIIENNAGLTAEIESNELLIDEIGRRIRSISYDMMPTALLGSNLERAVKSLAGTLSTSSGIAIEIVADNLTTDISRDTQMALYRVVNEYFNNILKHSGAKQVVVELSGSDEGYQISIEDDGKEYDFENALIQSSGLGLKGIVGRISQVNGVYKHMRTDTGFNKFNISLKLTDVL